MPPKRDTLYRTTPFSKQTPHSTFYHFMNISDCFLECYENCEDIIKCRAIGLLFSEHGRFYLKDLHQDTKIQLSMLYMMTSPKSTVIPYPVQVFGDLQWRKRCVIIVRIMKTETIPMAFRLYDSINGIISKHRAHVRPEESNET